MKHRYVITVNQSGYLPTQEPIVCSNLDDLKSELKNQLILETSFEYAETTEPYVIIINPLKDFTFANMEKYEMLSYANIDTGSNNPITCIEVCFYPNGYED